MIETDAWVLHRGPVDPEPGELVLEKFSFPDIETDEVFAEPLFGCWEGNMTHAVLRDPIDICRRRGEAKIVLGNAGVVRILQTGSDVYRVKEGDLCVLNSVAIWDDSGYPEKILAYDAPGTMGVLAKKIKLNASQVFPIFEGSKHSLQQWAAFPIRYATAWDNWKVAYRCWRVQMNEDNRPVPHVWGWGGGVTLGELALAKRDGCRATLIASKDERLALAHQMGINTVDRREFIDLAYDEEMFATDLSYRQNYMRAEITFLEIVRKLTDGRGVDIFIDNIGGPVHRATLKALARQGVVTTAGWKEGMHLTLTRGVECINRHMHIHTHGGRDSESAYYYAEETGWMPPVDDKVYGWDEIPLLAEAYANGEVNSYFPIFQVNPL